jgi:hypothetical protein
MEQRELVSPGEMFEQNTVHQFVRVRLDDGQERTVHSVTADGLMLGGGLLVFWEQRRIREVTHTGNPWATLRRPDSLPVVITSPALGIDRSRSITRLAA